MFRPLLLTALLFAMPLASYAQVLILGGSAGKECYTAVKLNPFPSTRHERTCSDSIESGTLDRINLAGTFVNRGIIRMRMGRHEAALEDYARAERIMPNSGPLFLNKGAALIGIGDFDGALVALNRALALETQDPHAAYFNLGVAHELLGDINSAFQSYQTALELRPDWRLPSQALERFTVVRE